MHDLERLRCEFSSQFPSLISSDLGLLPIEEQENVYKVVHKANYYLKMCNAYAKNVNFFCSNDAYST